MKTLIAATFLLLHILMGTFAQAQPDSQTSQAIPSANAEVRSAEKNTVIVREYIELGRISGDQYSSIEINGVLIYLPGQVSETLRTINLKVKVGDESQQEGSAFVDSEEIHGFAEAIQSIYLTALAWKLHRKHFSEIFYITRDNFALGLWQEGDDQKAYGQTGYTDKLCCYFDPGDLSKLKEVVGNAIAFVEHKEFHSRSNAR